MTRHRTKSSFGQCQCLWCGRRPTGDDCPVDDAMRNAIKSFASANGRTWKAQLAREWAAGGGGLGEDIRQPLMLARNIIGTHGLRRITPRMLA